MAALESALNHWCSQQPTKTSKNKKSKKKSKNKKLKTKNDLKINFSYSDIINLTKIENSFKELKIFSISINIKYFEFFKTSYSDNFCDDVLRFRIMCENG